ncbi:SDR family oxidoreductase [Leucobacter sp. W1038]|uniref:SDR family oxidoreductase n=1 Tax=Leucobacter sp. W1038 TaxID=3438281 RepID=UPI003D9933DA
MSTSAEQPLSSKRVLVTGGSRGLGRGIAEAMTAAGARVAIAARTPEQVDRTAQEIEGVSGHVFDIADYARIPELLAEVEEELGGPITSVVHSAGVQHRQPAEEFDLDAFRKVIEVNLIAPFALTQAIASRQLELEIGGEHVFIGSLTSFISMPGIPAYGAAKSGVYGLVRSLSSEWASRGIRVNGIAPGYIRTELTEAVFANEDWQRVNLARIPQGRFGEAADIGGAAVFLVSPAAGHITGHMLPVDGGWLAA